MGQSVRTITPNLRTIADIPLSLKGDDYPRLMEVRGEVYMPYRQLQAGERKRASKRASRPSPIRATPRPAGCASSIPPSPASAGSGCSPSRWKRSKESCRRRTHSEELELLAQWGFQVEPNHKRFDTLEEVQAEIDDYEALIPKLAFQADGVVVKVDRLAPARRAGRGRRTGAALGDRPEVRARGGRDELRRSLINVGRTGALNPYAVLEPVRDRRRHRVARHAAQRGPDRHQGHPDRRPGRGDPGRRSDPPDRAARSSQRRRRRERAVRMPDHCPACGTPVERPTDEAMRYCPNATCPGRVLEGIVHYASRGAMDIRGLGYERVRQLLRRRADRGTSPTCTTSPSAQLVELERFARQSAEQLVAAIEDSKSRPLSLLLFGLGIRHVGKTVAVLLARRFGTWTRSKAASEESTGSRGSGRRSPKR